MKTVTDRKLIDTNDGVIREDVGYNHIDNSTVIDVDDATFSGANEHALEKITNHSWLMIGSKLSCMRKQGLFCDIKLAGSDFSTEKTYINAHSTVLAASSKYFYNSFITENLISSHRHESLIYNINDLTTLMLQVVVDFVYGKVPSSEVELQMLEKGAEVLDVEAAQEYLSSLMFNSKQTRRSILLEKYAKKRNNLVRVKFVPVSKGGLKRIVSIEGACVKSRLRKIKRRENVNVSCFKCNRNFYTYKNVAAHLLAKHNIHLSETTVVLKCDNCPCLFWNMNALDTHKELCKWKLTKTSCINGNESQFDFNRFSTYGCSLCPHIYISQYALDNHIRKSHIASEIQCDSLVESLVDVNVKEELDTTAEEDEVSCVQFNEEEHQCDLCEKTFNNNTLLGAHRLKTHGITSRFKRAELDDKGNYRCGLCVKTFKTKQRLYHHRDYHYKAQQCKLCLKKCYNSFQMILHFTQNHDGHEYYMCCICGRTVYQTRQAVKHFMLEHDIDASYPSLRGLKAILNPMNMKKHVSLYSAVQSAADGEVSRWGSTWLKKHFPCPYCTQVFQSVDEFVADLKQHLVQENEKLITLDQRDHECQICGALFDLNQQLMAHIRALHQHLLTCSQCGCIYDTFAGLKQHAKTHLLQFPEPLRKNKDEHYTNMKCAHCKEDFKRNAFKFLIHNYKEHENNWCMCSLCGHGLQSMAYMRRHISLHGIKTTNANIKALKLILNSTNIETIEPLYTGMIQSGESKRDDLACKWLLSEFVCTFCSKIFESTQDLATHVQTHLVLDEETLSLMDKGEHECTTCGEHFKTALDLGKHKLVVHTEGFTCQFCGKVFYAAYNLSIHQKIHSSVKSYMCRICGRGFTQNSHMHDHMKIHSDTREYSCEHCGNQFKFRSALKNHIERLHNPNYVKRYPCDECGERYHTKTMLKNHQAKHSDARPFVCEQCGKTFKLSRHRTRHMKTHGCVSLGRGRRTPGVSFVPDRLPPALPLSSIQKQQSADVLQEIHEVDYSSTSEHCMYDVLHIH